MEKQLYFPNIHFNEYFYKIPLNYITFNYKIINFPNIYMLGMSLYM
jgi:hypothetical protein